MQFLPEASADATASGLVITVSRIVAIITQNCQIRNKCLIQTSRRVLSSRNCVCEEIIQLILKKSNSSGPDGSPRLCSTDGVYSASIKISPPRRWKPVMLRFEPSFPPLCLLNLSRLRRFPLRGNSPQQCQCMSGTFKNPGN